MDTLGDGYTPADLRAVIAGEKAHTPRKNAAAPVKPEKRSGNLLVDIQAKLRAGKGAGYARWATLFNLKQMAQTVAYLQDHELLDYAILSEKAAAASAHFNELSARIKSAETRMAEIAVLREHIVGYAKTRDTYVAYQMKNETGDGTATYYEVYPGIGVIYNDFHMASCPPRRFDNTHYISIHHCREGRIEWEVSNGAYLYLASGDIMLDSSATENNHCSFPVSHYHGITITISVPEAAESLGELLSLFSINLEQIEHQFALKARPFIMHGNSVPDHVISELYQVPENIRLEYLRVKVLELLVTLKTVDPTVLGVERPYFYKTQVEKVKAIMAFMTEEPERHFTMEELSEKFDISTSALKQCFKGVYGTAI